MRKAASWTVAARTSSPAPRTARASPGTPRPADRATGRPRRARRRGRPARRVGRDRRRPDEPQRSHLTRRPAAAASSLTRSEPPVDLAFPTAGNASGARGACVGRVAGQRRYTSEPFRRPLPCRRHLAGRGRAHRSRPRGRLLILVTYRRSVAPRCRGRRSARLCAAGVRRPSWEPSFTAGAARPESVPTRFAAGARTA